MPIGRNAVSYIMHMLRMLFPALMGERAHDFQITYVPPGQITVLPPMQSK